MLLPCGGVGCYWGTQTKIQPPSNKLVDLKVQGKVYLGSTLFVYTNVVLEGDAGGTMESFQNRGPGAQINGAQVEGTLGTAVTAINTPENFTPTFTQGSISNFEPANSWITIIDPVSVTTTGNVTSTAWTGNSYNVTAALSAYTRLAPGSIINVTGCANSAYNVTGAPIIVSDYSKQTIGWPETGVGAGSTTGCTISGMNQDTFESVQITAVSGSTLTASFMHTHSAAAQWGMVGVALQPASGPDEVDYLSVQQALGAEFVGDNIAETTLIGDGFASSYRAYSIAAEMNAGETTIRDSTFDNMNLNYPPTGCTSNCPSPAYPSGALRFTYETSIPNQGGCGYCWLENDTFAGGGVEVDNNQTNGAAAAVPNFYNDSFREVPQAGIVIDNRYGYTNGFVLRDSRVQDDFLGYPAPVYVVFTDAGGFSMGGELQIENPQTSVVQAPVNSYFQGSWTEDNANQAVQAYPIGYPSGTYEVGGQLATELVGEGAGLGPSVIPYATLAVTSPPTCGTACTISSVLAPDGTNSAVELDAPSGGGTAPGIGGQVYPATYPGDWIIYGTSIRHGVGLITPYSAGGCPFQLVTQGTDTIAGGCLSSFDIGVQNSSWRREVGLATVTAGESTTHPIALRMYPGPSAGQGNQYWNWFWMYIPGPNNPAYTGVTVDEVNRWRQELMHGYVPSGLTANEGVLAMAPSHKLYWGNDTDLYRGAAGVVETDGAINAANGYEVNGAALGTVNLADWTNSGVANGDVPVWNSSTSKWTPGTLPSNVSSINGNSGAFTFTGAGVSCAGTTCTVAGSTASGNVQAGSEYSPAYYNQSGSNTTVGGVAPFTGLGYWSADAPPAAATAAQIVSAIGTAAVANATSAASATNFTGSLGGDVAGTQGATTVGKINGGALPASATVMGTNSSGQPVAATTTGSGSVVLATSPTLAGATTMQGSVTLENGANANQMLAIQPGSSTDYIGALQFDNYSGTAEWQVRKDTTNYLRVTDSVNSLDRVILPPSANTTINAGAGANAVVINNTSGSGTGGFVVYEGGSNYSTSAFQVTGSGNATATGFLQGKFIMGTGTMTMAAGAAAGSSPSITCATNHLCDGVSGTVTLTTGTSPTTGALATLSFPNTHTNQANCIVTTLSATGVVTSNTWAESTTAITITANAAPAASTAYTIKYWCGGY